MVFADLVARLNRKSKVVRFLKQAAKCRRQAANETDARQKAELLLYAAEFEAKAREQRKPPPVDRMGATIDWLDAYRAASLSIVHMYAEDGSVECGCGGQKVLSGFAAISEYWQQQLVEKPAGELEDLQINSDGIVVTFRVPDGLVQAALHFTDEGKIGRSRCGPAEAAMTTVSCQHREQN